MDYINVRPKADV